MCRSDSEAGARVRGRRAQRVRQLGEEVTAIPAAADKKSKDVPRIMEIHYAL
jgi:hypothetical protein